MTMLLLLAAALCACAAAAPKHIVDIVADDLGRNDLGARNGGRTFSPNIDALIAAGVSLTSYNTFKICSPSRASTLTGRYPFNAGEAKFGGGGGGCGCGGGGARFHLTHRPPAVRAQASTT
jgi:arylsulfatase A-like enzyme